MEAWNPGTPQSPVFHRIGVNEIRGQECFMDGNCYGGKQFAASNMDIFHTGSFSVDENVNKNKHRVHSRCDDM